LPLLPLPRKEKEMYLVKNVGKVLLEYALDETIPGRHPRCVVCHSLLLASDEIIILRRDKVTGQGIREGLFFCGNPCAGEVARTIKELLGEAE